jgi:hypothetical protein
MVDRLADVALLLLRLGMYLFAGLWSAELVWRMSKPTHKRPVTLSLPFLIVTTGGSHLLHYRTAVTVTGIRMVLLG